MKHTRDTIVIRNLSTGYVGKKRTHVVARAVSGTIKSGELTCLLGANGAGKSTLLHTLAGFLPKLGGSISILGRDIESYSDAELATVMSVVLTEKCDLRNMTAWEMVSLGRSPYTGFWGILRSEDKDRVTASIEAVGIEPLAHRMMHTLSDGEKQKVMIAKALAQETPVVFLDEPTAFLDFPSKVEMMQLLHRLSRRLSKTIFLSTHDLELALQIADRVWLMDKEQGITVGTPEDLALQGHLGSFFSRKGISFDSNTGLFRIDNELTSTIRLGGHGPRYAMVRKALQRNGILAGRDVESAEHIEIVGEMNDTTYLYKHGHRVLGQAQSIEELLWLVEKQRSDSASLSR